MTAATVSMTDTKVSARKLKTIKTIDKVGLIISIITIICAVIWAFPLYWAVVTSVKPENQVVEPGLALWPRTFTLEAYSAVIFNTKIGIWYFNSIAVALITTAIVVLMSACCGYAISQLNFPGRKVLWFVIIASFMVPIQALIVNHYILAAQFKLINTWAGIIMPSLIAPMATMIYKQFFDGVPKEFREAAIMDNTNEFRMLFRIYLPMNWGVTTALAIITFIGAWNSFLWPFLATTREDAMTVAVGITQVNDAFGIAYARELAAAVLTGLPVAIVYLLFQRRVTQAIMLSAGVKG
jgi:multiple sugar transport system permease protein